MYFYVAIDIVGISVSGEIVKGVVVSAGRHFLALVHHVGIVLRERLFAQLRKLDC